MKKAIVVDWLDKYAGSERVIRSLDTVFDFDECYTLIDIMNEEDRNLLFHNKQIPVKTSFLQNFGSYFRLLLPLFPLFCKQLKVSKDIDLIISSSHAIAKSINKKNVLHISYFQARNLKYVWEEKSLYFTGVKLLFKIFIPFLQRFDLKSSQIPDHIVVNSIFVQRWVKDVYKRDSTVVYPPVDVDRFSLVEEKEDYYISVGRLEPYKRFDILVKAFNLNKKKLVIIGNGSQFDKLIDMSGPNIQFTGYLREEQVNEYISKAKAFVFAGLEDFGIALVEAQACGTPVVCFKEGGAAETVCHMKTGVHFNEQKVESLNEAIEKLENNYSFFLPVNIRKHAEKFSKERFEKEMKAFVDQKVKLRENTL